MTRLSMAALAPLTRWLGVLAPLAIIGGPSPADILCSTVAVLFLIHAVWLRDFAWLRQDWLIAGLVLWAYSCIRALFAPDIVTGLSLALPFVRYLIFAAALQALVLREAMWRRRVVIAAVIALGLLSLDGLLQYVAGQDILGHPRRLERIVAIYQHPWVGTIIAWLFLPAALGLVTEKRFALAASFAALCLAVILLSGDRMAWLLTLLAIGLLGLFCLRVRKARRAFLIAVPLGLLGLGTLLYLNPAIYQRQVVSSYEMMRNLPKSHYGVIWTSALKMSADHPLFGIGPRAFRTVCPDPRYGPLFPYRRGDLRCATHPHNFYLEWLVETGMAGLGLFVLTMALIVKRCASGLFRAPLDWVRVGLFVTLLARLWPLASSTSFHHAWSAVPFWLVAGWGLALSSAAAPVLGGARASLSRNEQKRERP